MLYELIPNMPEVRLRPLVEKFGSYINQHPSLNQTILMRLKMRDA